MGEQTDGRRKRLLSKVKPPKQSPKSDTLPPLPVVTATDTPPRKKGIGSVRFRKKVKPSVEPAIPRPIESPVSVDVDISPTGLNQPNLSSEDSVFVPQNRFAMRRGMTHHPYPREDAPYMLSYDRMVMDK